MFLNADSGTLTLSFAFATSVGEREAIKGEQAKAKPRQRVLVTAICKNLFLSISDANAFACYIGHAADKHWLGKHDETIAANHCYANGVGSLDHTRRGAAV